MSVVLNEQYAAGFERGLADGRRGSRAVAIKAVTGLDDVRQQLLSDGMLSPQVMFHLGYATGVIQVLAPAEGEG